MGGKKRPEKVLNGAGTHVWLHNPATGGVWECPLDAEDLFTKHLGWEYADAPGPTLEGLFDASTAEGANQTGFDPAEHNVEGEDGVNTYLKQALAAGADGEVERVLELERAGQNRVTVVDPRPEPELDPDPEDDDPNNALDHGGPGNGDD